MAQRRAALRAALALAAFAPPALACELPGGPAQSLRSGAHTLLYRAEPALRVGEHFAVAIAVCPEPDRVRVDAWMPEHRHGMNYRPSVQPLGGGRYRAEGLLFHMPGRWEFLFELRAGGLTQRFAHAVRVE